MPKRKRVNGGRYGSAKRRKLIYRRRFARGVRPRGPLLRGRLARTGGYAGRYGVGTSEAKFHDVTLDDAVTAAAGAITDSVVKIAQGVTESTRVGRKCVITKIMWRYYLHMPEIDGTGDPPPPDVCRVILYVDHQCNGATAAVLDILESTDIRSFNNLANSSRFTILMDRVHDMPRPHLTNEQAAATLSCCKYFKSFSFYKSCSIPLEFTSTTGAITEITTNNIGVLIISEASVCGLDSHFRFRFRDQ